MREMTSAAGFSSPSNVLNVLLKELYLSYSIQNLKTFFCYDQLQKLMTDRMMREILRKTSYFILNVNNTGWAKINVRSFRDRSTTTYTQCKVK